MERSIAVEPTIRSNAGILSDVRYKVPYKFVLETQVHIVYFEDSGQRDSLIQSYLVAPNDLQQSFSMKLSQTDSDAFNVNAVY